MKTLPVKNYTLIKESLKSYLVDIKGELIYIPKECSELKEGTLFITEIAARTFKIKGLISGKLPRVQKIASLSIPLPTLQSAFEYLHPKKAISEVKTFNPKFIGSSRLFYEAVRDASKVIKKTHPLPILDNVCLKLEKNILTVIGSNLEKFVTKTLEVESHHYGQMAVPAETLKKLLYLFPDSPLSFEMNVKNWQFIITSENGVYKIGSYDGEEFPIEIKS